jgi:hypothetical protein
MADNNSRDPRRKAYIESRAKGLSRQQSAIAAGYSDADKSGAHVERGVSVQQELAAIRKEAAENAGVTKDMVAEGFKDAAEMARVMADPQGMVAAWRELGKLLGFYAPEVKKLEKGINKKELKKALEDLEDEDLIALARGRVIDGEVTRVDGPKAD